VSAKDDENPTAIMGTLVGFLVVGIIGVYIGDQMVESASLVPASTAFFYSNGTEVVSTSPDYGNTSLGSWTNVTEDSLYGAQSTVIDTFSLGVTLCKLIIVVSVASIVFVTLQRTGLVPKFSGRKREYD